MPKRGCILKSLKKAFAAVIAASLILVSPQGKADMFGGDVVVLTQILANAIQQLIQLREILQTGGDTLDLMKEINRGIKDGLNAIRMINPKFNPGLYGNLNTAEQVLSAIEDLYGRIPQTREARLLEAQDRSVAESIAMNSTLYEFANQADKESQRIMDHAAVVNPQGAGKLTAQSIAVLIGVTTQVLRTNSMMLKMMGQDMALSNRKGKLQAEQFKNQYEGISESAGQLPKKMSLQTVNGGL